MLNIKNKNVNIKYIQEFVNQSGYELLSIEYNSKRKLRFRCRQNHTFSSSWTNFYYNSTRCPYCSGNKRKSISYVKEQFLKFGYMCLSTSYKNNRSSLKIQCPNGHIYTSTYDYFQRGSRCPICVCFKGNKNPNWRGGISKEPYCFEFTTDLKEYIKYRDNYICLSLSCGSKKDLVVHHIDYNKKHCEEENLITLCRSCNFKANFNRKWHEEIYKRIIEKRKNR